MLGNRGRREQAEWVRGWLLLSWALQGHFLSPPIPAGQAQSGSDDGVRGGREIEKG